MKTLLRILFAVAIASPAFAWNKPGHMLTGSIAYLELKSLSPAAAAEAVKLLKEHQSYALWKQTIDAQGMSAEQSNEYLFMMAARWPDDARGTPEHRESWHFINMPFVSGSTQGINVPSTPPGDVVTQIAANLAILQGAGAARDRAKALSWLLHMVGDIHQPLHAVALYSADQPGWKDGDKGGNQFYVKPSADRSIVKLHSLWDGIVIGSERAQTVRTAARRLRGERDSGSFASALAVGWNPQTWADESLQAAKSVVYVDEGQRIPGADDDHSTTAPLPAGYLDAAGDLGEQRVCLAAYRLAAKLKDVFGGP